MLTFAVFADVKMEMESSRTIEAAAVDRTVLELTEGSGVEPPVARAVMTLSIHNYNIRNLA